MYLLLLLLFTLPLEGVLEHKQFLQEWKGYVHQKQLDLTQIGTELHLATEFACLEEFGALQLHRRRPFVQGVDHDPRWGPFQENKITLQNGSELSASFLHYASPYHTFIASQAPQKAKLDLFWQMIWEKELNQIVMVTELEEPKRSLCPRYWPERLNETLTLENGLQVTLVKERDYLSELKNSIQVRTLELRYKNQVRLVTHYWYRNWIDGTAPNQMTTLFTMIGIVKREKRGASPILVHCHGGVGRTGTFIALYHMLQRDELEDTPISLFECVAHMRWQRSKMVSNLMQYQFCHRFLQALKIQRAATW